MRYVGKSCPIHDAKEKVTGNAMYAGDMELPNMLHMALKFSTIPHGFVKNLDCTKALNYPGVVDVIHCFNTTNKEYNQYQTQFGQELYHTNRLFNSHVRYVGDRIAGVIARSSKIAREALELIEVEYEDFPFSISMKETLSGKIDNIHETGAVFDCGTLINGELPTDEELIEISSETNLSRINHICMETHACVADYNKYTDSLTIYSPNQTVYGIRSILGDLFEMEYNKIRVVKTTMGGSFGAKQEWILEPVVAAAALKVKRPVKLVFSRAETIISTFSRSPMHFDSKHWFTKDGRLIGLESSLNLEAGAYLGNSINYARTVGHKLHRAYKYPFLKFNAKAIITNTIISGAFRGWTSPEATIMLEHGINVAAKRLNIDPIDIRLMNIMHEGDIDQLSNKGIGSFRADKALIQGRKHFEWDKKKEEVLKFNAINKRYKIGIGVGLGAHVNSFYPSKTDYARVDLRMSETGGVDVNITLHDHGCGTVQAFKMIAAEALEIDIEKINIGEGDTKSTPLDVGCFSSRTIFVQGRALIECVKEFKIVLRKCFAKLTGADFNDISVSKGNIYSNDKTICMSFSEIAFKAQQILKQEIFASINYIPDTNPGVCGAHFAMVKVDTYTGMTKLLDYLAVHDVGQAINREICIAQVQGAVVMGAGAVISEHVITRANGKPSGNLKDYHVITAAEIPVIKVELIEDRGTEGPYGAKSIGEVAHTPVSATIIAAINCALDSELNNIPLSPDVIVEYLKERGCK